MNTKNKALKRKAFNFLLGDKINADSLKADYTALYKEYNEEFKTALKPL